MAEGKKNPVIQGAVFLLFVLLVAGLAWLAAGKGGAGSPAPAASAPRPKLMLLDEGGCLGCMLKKGLLAELAAAYPGRLSFDYVNVKTERKKTERYGVRNVPAQIGFDAAGRELFLHEGALTAAEVAANFLAAGIDLSRAPSPVVTKTMPPGGGKGL